MFRIYSGRCSKRARDRESYRPLWYFYLLTGVRRGEALGVQWRDIDWDRGTVYICRTIHTDQGLSQPKTRSSTRVIDLPPDLLTLLGALRDQ